MAQDTSNDVSWAFVIRFTVPFVVPFVFHPSSSSLSWGGDVACWHHHLRAVNLNL
jgi:hypothetical protein